MYVIAWFKILNGRTPQKVAGTPGQVPLTYTPSLGRRFS